MIRKTTQIYLTTLLALSFLSIPAMSQFTRIGGGLTFSPGVDNQTFETGNPGFNVRGIYEIGDKFWAKPSLTVYLPKSRTGTTGDKRTTWFITVDADATYTLATEGPLLFYALGGINFTSLYSSYKSDDPSQENIYEAMPGLNIGTGIEMIINKEFNAFTQIKYVVGKYQYLVISLGVHYYITTRRFKTW